MEEKKQEYVSKSERLLENLEDSIGLDHFVWANQGAVLSDFAERAEPDALLEHKAIVLQRMQVKQAIKEANIYRRTINFNTYVMPLMGCLGLLANYLFGGQIASLCLENAHIRACVFWGAFCCIANPFSLAYLQIERFLAWIFQEEKIEEQQENDTENSKKSD